MIRSQHLVLLHQALLCRDFVVGFLAQKIAQPFTERVLEAMFEVYGDYLNKNGRLVGRPFCLRVGCCVGVNS